MGQSVKEGIFYKNNEIEQNLEINQNYKEIKVLGRGAFGIIILISKDNNYYALKKINIMGLSNEEIETCKNEINILSRFNNNFIVKYYNSYKDNNFLNIIMEYGGDSNLKKFIQKYKDKNQLIDEPILKKIIFQICSGLQQIHNANIIHRDLKPENIFINENNDIKIGDFGISKILETNKKYAKSNVGTFQYMALEIKDGKYDNKVDMYSLGCIMYELFHLRTFYYDKMDDDEEVRKIDPDIYNEKWEDLIVSLLKTKSYKRFDINQTIKYIIDNNLN
jgi:NIMA (never in mitosis gene a)-related kinase